VGLRRVDDAVAAVERHGTAILPYPHFAHLLMESGEIGQALQFVTEWTNKRPRDAEGWKYMAYLCERGGRHKDALGYYDQAVQRAPLDHALRKRREQVQAYVDAQAFVQAEGGLP